MSAKHCTHGDGLGKKKATIPILGVGVVRDVGSKYAEQRLCKNKQNLKQSLYVPVWPTRRSGPKHPRR